MNIKGAIFDMDGTIIDSLSFWGHLWKNLGKAYFGKDDFTPAEEVDKAVRTMIYTEAMSYFREYYDIKEDKAEFLAFCEEWIPEFYKTVAKPKSGAYELLKYLKDSGVKICLASASARYIIDLALEYHGLAEFFDHTISCVEIGVGKDKPDVYLEALRLLGVSADEAAVFEDSPLALETAKSIGVHTVGIYDKYNFDVERLKAASELFVDENQSLFTLSLMIND